jgi:hypothetical protein
VALNAARALVAAQLQSSWNRLRHESGIAGSAATAGLLAVVVVPTLLLPALLMLRIGADLGEGLARGGTAEALRFWNGLQGVFTLLFALLGSFRFKPALSFSEFGRYPFTRSDLALAEFPAAVFEVLPLLGVVGIVATNAGLASRMPAFTPLILLLSLLNIAAMLSLMVLSASIWRLLMQRQISALATGLFVAGALAGAGSYGWMEALRALVPHALSLIARMPGSYGYGALVALRLGELTAGATGFGLAVVSTAGLGILSGVVHHRVFVGGGWSPGAVRREPPVARDRGPAGEIARLFFMQLRGSRTVRIQLVLPLLFTGTGAFVARETRRAVENGKDLPEVMTTIQSVLAGFPFLAITLFLCVAVNGQIWMNLFGWDRPTIRALLQLPILPRSIVSGKLLGLLQFTLLQGSICSAGLSFVYRPSLREVVGGIAAAGFAFFWTFSVGLFVSLQAPRAVPRGGMAAMPLYLSWIPGLLSLFLAAALRGTWELGSLGGAWGAPVAVCAALGGSVALWPGILPQSSRWFDQGREKLLAM